MKSPTILRIFSLLFCIILFSECSRNRAVGINTMRPAEITFPTEINKLLLVNRTKFDKQAKNIIEGVLTGELPGEDKAGLQAAMRSFRQTLMMSPRFQLVDAAEILDGNSMTAAFPDPLPWSQVEALCTKYNTDAIVSMEIFDTDFIVIPGKRKVKKTIEENGVKREIEVDEYYAQGVGNAKMGIRLYDPKAKSIVDEQLFTQNNTWTASASNPAEALTKLIIKSQATQYLASQGGASYAYKIAPMPVTLTREFYKKTRKEPLLAAGVRKADVNDWKGAIHLWEKALERSNGKDAGRICYNMAVAYEVLGELDKAKQWASKSYVNYGNKKARYYATAIDYRKSDEQKVEQQMK